MERIYDANLIAPAIDYYLGDKSSDVDPIEWISKPENIVLRNDKGDMAFFEPGIRHIYSGHYYFKSRGREALDSGREFLDEIFSSCYNIPVMTGLVPVKRRDVAWMTRRLGFTSYGEIHIADLDMTYELFILTKKDYME